MACKQSDLKADTEAWSTPLKDSPARLSDDLAAKLSHDVSLSLGDSPLAGISLSEAVIVGDLESTTPATAAFDHKSLEKQAQAAAAAEEGPAADGNPLLTEIVRRCEIELMLAAKDRAVRAAMVKQFEAMVRLAMPAGV